MATNEAPQRNFFAQRAHRFLAALVFRDFRFMAFATLCSSSGAWALIVARGAWVFSIPELEGTQGLWVGLITFAAMSPRFFTTPFIGYLADKMTRKTMLQRVYILQIVQASIMAILVMTGVSNPWYVVILAVINGTLRTAQMTAAQSLTPNLVDRERLPNAVALNQAMQQGSRAIGPTILLVISVTVGSAGIFGSGGFSFNLQDLVVTMGTSAIVFWSCATFYLVALISAMNIRTVSSGVIDRRRSFWVNAAAGFVYAYTTPLIFGILLMAVAHCVLVMSFESMLPPLALEKLSVGRRVQREPRLCPDGGPGRRRAFLVAVRWGHHQPHDARPGVPVARVHQQPDAHRHGSFITNGNIRDRRRSDGAGHLRLHDHHPHRDPDGGAGRNTGPALLGVLYAHRRQHGVR